ncbi:MAG TPA: lipoate--protein ligase family protein [Gemmatimonadaceae bacterium]|nr:lipoate--protein ligase family protein [Gemmatimonadaceae bacterium]
MTTLRPGTLLDAPKHMDGTWRTLVTPPLSGAANMALDHALMERARRTGERVFRVYSWSQPTLSLGRHQMSRNRINTGAARELGVALVRRPTGGRALLHHREVTYSVTTALSRHDSVRGWYASISSVLLDALRLLGVKAETATPAGRTPLPATASCFVQPDDGEITVDGRKLVGSALLRQQDALLQHGSILLDDDQPLLNAVLPEDELRPTPAGTLRQAMAVTPSFDDVAAALFSALRAIPRVRAAELDLDARLRDEAADWERVYGSEEWTYKR